MKFGYTTAGFIGAWVGFNLGIALFQADKIMDMVPVNLMSEAIVLMVLGGTILDLYQWSKTKLSKNNAKLSPWLLPVIVYVAGFFWELGTYGVGGGWLPFASNSLAARADYLIAVWAVYGLVSIVFLGLPVLFLIDYTRKHKKLFGFELQGANGLSVALVLCGLATLFLLKLILDFQVFHVIEAVLP